MKIRSAREAVRMGRQVRSIARAARKSGAGGLAIVVGGCVLITYMFAHKISGDEAIKSVLFTLLGTIVVLWKVQQQQGEWRPDSRNGHGRDDEEEAEDVDEIIEEEEDDDEDADDAA